MKDFTPSCEGSQYAVWNGCLEKCEHPVESFEDASPAVFKWEPLSCPLGTALPALILKSCIRRECLVASLVVLGWQQLWPGPCVLTPQSFSSTEWLNQHNIPPLHILSCVLTVVFITGEGSKSLRCYNLVDNLNYKITWEYMTFLSSNKLKSKGFDLYRIFKITKLKKKIW